MKSLSLFKMIFILMLQLMIFTVSFSMQNVLTGTIKGQLVDAETNAPLPGANIVIENSALGAASNLSGQFEIKKVPVGNYTLKFSYIGYEPRKLTDIIVKSSRTTIVNAALKIAPLEMAGVEVTGGYFSESDEQPVSAVNFSYEEIRRAPGSAGDVSRIIMSLPAIAKVNDQTNNLIVRGGSPLENAFYVDNIEIPNINHFPTQGSSGGPLGLINVDFIQDVNFMTGGYSVIYGDKLSSIMEMSFRDGNRDEYDGQLDLNFAGFGGVAEGPLPGKKGSFLLSARRSFLDVLVDVIDVGSTVAPSYGDYQGKIVYDVHPNHKLMLIGIWGDDHNNPDRETGIENDMLYYGNQDIYENTTGLTWRALWNKNAYSKNSVSYTSTKFDEDFYETNTGLPLTRNRSHEQTYKFRSMNHIRLNARNSLEFGMDANHLRYQFDNYYAEITDAVGDTVSALRFKNHVRENKVGAFLNYIAKPLPRLTTTIGVRADYFSYNEDINIAPRIATSLQLTPLTKINASAGIYYQNLPLLLLAQSSINNTLKDPVAVHFVLGLEHLLKENTRLTLEIYQKDYNHFPLDPSQPQLFLIDEIYYRYGFFMNHGQLIDGGKAKSQGVEVMVQKKLAKNFYGLASASYFRSRYRDGSGVWRNRVFDNRYLFSLEGGYKPNRNWEFSVRWLYAGGAPYTPFNETVSRQQHRAVLDESRINDARYPAYHSMNLRLDRRFHFRKTNLIAYVSVWNAYNRKNIATYFWNDTEQKTDEIYQWLLLPIFGLEYEF